ncbi:molybdopterin dinucleotide binding domain-containing protein [Methanomethylovorans sp.]|uniref:molybdopterin dinucleotide binding domain-containing protein n=1 Tax=Methanomethylovorans sp. TaxID=2758717 RepID=UPI00351C2049
MGFGQFLSEPEFKFIIVTHRDIFQNTAQENSRFSDQYAELSSVIRLDKEDMNKIGLRSGDLVVVKNTSGRVVLKVESSVLEQPHPGTAFMVNGPWANALVAADTGGTGVPAFKKIEIVLSRSKGEKVTSLAELI